MGVILLNQKKNQVTTLKKIWVDATIKKSQVARYKNLGGFYRVPFKSLLRVQIKQVKEKSCWLFEILITFFLSFIQAVAWCDLWPQIEWYWGCHGRQIRAWTAPTWGSSSKERGRGQMGHKAVSSNWRKLVFQRTPAQTNSWS